MIQTKGTEKTLTTGKRATRPAEELGAAELPTGKGIHSSIEVKRNGQKIRNKDDKRKAIKIKFWDRQKLKKKPTKSYMITMFHGNGTSRTFVVLADAEAQGFNVGKRHYMIIPEESWFDLSLNCYHMYYHYLVAVPLNREFVLMNGEENEAFFSVSPSALREYVKMRAIKTIVGSETNKWIMWVLIGAAVLIALWLLKGGK